MKKFQSNTQISYCGNSRDLVIPREENKITKFKRLLIYLFPFATYFGQFISIKGINISNIYSLILGIYVVDSLLRKKYDNIIGYIIFFYVMVFYAFASLIWGQYSDVGVTIIFPLFTGLVAMTFIAFFAENELLLFLKVLSVFTIIVLIMSIFEIFTGKYLFFNNLDFIYIKNGYNLHYPGVAFANPNDLSQYLLVGFPLLILRWLEKRKQMIVAMVLFLVTIFVMISTLSRLSLISTVIIVAFYLAVSLSTNGNKSLKILVVLILSFALISVLPYLGINFSIYDIINDFLKVDSSQGYFNARETIYLKVLELGLSNMIFGAGLGGSYTVSLIGPHNLFLFIFADLGIIFAIGFAVVLVCTFFSLYKNKSINICGCKLNRIIISILITFPMFSSMSSGNEQRKIIWIFLGLIFASINISKKIRHSNLIENNKLIVKG